MTYREKYNIDALLNIIREMQPDLEEYISKCKLLKEYFEAKQFYEDLLKTFIIKDEDEKEK